MLVTRTLPWDTFSRVFRIPRHSLTSEYRNRKMKRLESLASQSSVLASVLASVLE
jgi:hypothetical protein